MREEIKNKKTAIIFAENKKSITFADRKKPRWRNR